MGCSLKKQNQDRQQLTSPKQLLKFKITFSNIKVKNLPLKKARVHFSIGKDEVFQTTVESNANPHWKSNFQTTCEIDIERLKIESFKISVVCPEKNKCMGYVLQNMQEVAVGPVHYDLFLESCKGKSRITFDLRMAQKTIVKISSKQVLCELKEHLMEQAFNFSLKVRSHSLDYQSDFSPKYLNPSLFFRQSLPNQYGFVDTKEKLRSDSDEFQLLNNNFNYDSPIDENMHSDLKSCQLQIQQLKNDKELILKKSISNNQLTSNSTSIPLATKQTKQKPLQNRRPFSNMTTTIDIVNKKEITWEFKVQENNPQIQFEIYVDEFSSSSFEFILWGNNKNNQSEKAELHILGNSIISMNRFFSQNVSLLADLDMLQVQEARFQDKLWNHGQSIGTVKADFIITNDPYYKQMLGGFRTEEGIQKSSLLYIKKDKYSCPSNQNMNEIIQINIQIDGLISQLNIKSLQHKEKKRISKQVSLILDKLNTIVKQQELYENLYELTNAQQVLTDLMKSLLESADLIEESLRDRYYDVLTTLLNRDEFFISHLGFDRNLKEIYQQKDDQIFVQKNRKEIEELEKKIRIGLHYQNFLHKTLEKVTQKLNQRGQNDKEEIFMNSVLVIAYFRIPQFQQIVINVLKQDQTDRLLREEFEQRDFTQINIENNVSTEWDKNFYLYLKSDPKYFSYQQQLEILLKQTDWKTIIINSKTFLKWFPLLLSHHKKAKHPYEMSAAWSGFPGYLVIIKYLLLEIKYTKELPYSEMIQEASCCILENENMLNYLVIVLFHKTKLYDGIEVFYALDMVNLWFDAIKKKNKKIPTDFNYQFLMKGLFLIFDGEHASSISKALLFIFNIFPQMPIDIQKEICDHILDHCYFKFFMFWSKLVRFVFQHFLIYRIQHRLRNYRNERIRDIQKEFECIKLQKKVHIIEEKAKLLNHLTYIRYSQMIELTLRIKRKVGQYNNQKERDVQLQIQAKSLKLKLIKKRQQQKCFKRLESPNHDQIDISFETLKRSNNSLTFSLNDPFYSAELVQDKNLELSNDYPLNNQEYDQNNEPCLLDRSLSSIINLNDLLADIETDKKLQEKRKSRQSRNSIKNNSVDLNSQTSQQDDKNSKKLKIYHRISNQDDIKKQIHKELLVYLFPAVQEWQEAQANYKRWFSKIQADLKKKFSSEKQDQALMDAEPPEIHLYVPKDETENIYFDQ